jgi:cytochrome c556
MLTKKTTAYLIAGAVTLGLSAGLAWAAADDTIKARQACMKSNGKMMGDLAKMFKGEVPYDAAAVQATFAPMNDACAKWDTFWTEDSMKGETAETWAKPEIWSDAAGFKAAGEKAYGAMQALMKSTDEASFKAAFSAVGDGCKGCHEKFRRPKEQ